MIEIEHQIASDFGKMLGRMSVVERYATTYIDCVATLDLTCIQAMSYRIWRMFRSGDEITDMKSIRGNGLTRRFDSTCLCSEVKTVRKTAEL